ncbi:MAG: DMT family transporter [Desulfomicrobium escambiense]|nr:DMT family transporter [Desulfomicrobium escambiense]
MLLAIAAIASGSSLAGCGWETYVACFVMALVCQILGHSIFNWALRHLDATVVAIAALGEPVGASILAFAILRERASPIEIAGGAAILAGIFLVMRFSPEASETKERISSGS